MSKPNLPPLPPEAESVYVSVDGLSTYREARDCYYTMDQMYAYAEEAVRQALAAQVPVVDERSVLANLLAHFDRITCTHEETHRGGVIWTICDECGKKWADDEGGFVPHVDAPAVAAARAALTSDQET